MARYSLVRGWLECTFEEVAAMRSAVEVFAAQTADTGLSETQRDLYMTGWRFPKHPINWISVVFFGANVNCVAVPFIRRMIEAAAAVGDEVDGLFYVDDEESEVPLQWRISGGCLDEVSK